MAVGHPLEYHRDEERQQDAHDPHVPAGALPDGVTLDDLETGPDGGTHIPDPRDPEHELNDVSGVSPQHAVKLFKAGFKSKEDLMSTDQSELSNVVGNALAARIKADVGELDPNPGGELPHDDNDTPLSEYVN